MVTKSTKDRTGLKYGPWTVIKYLRTETISNKKTPIWLCKCVCGEEREIMSKRLDHPPVCKCNINKKKREPIHGKSRERVYKIWSSMKARCRNKASPSYARYGAKGVTLCDEWENFEIFYADMGNPPTSIHSIDRIDGTKGYFKDNCKWSTPTEQANNRKTNIHITYNGETKTISEWARKTGLSKECINHRLKTGWPIEAIFIEKDMTGTRKYRNKKC